MSENKETPESQSPNSDPGIDQVYRYLMYGISLPERAVRSTAAMVGGVLHESASLLVPQAFRDSRTYNTFVKQMLDVVSNQVGGVSQDGTAGSGHANDGNTGETPPAKEKKEDAENVKPEETPNPDGETTPEVENYVARKAVSTFVDLAGMATFHVSPLTILAIVSDIAYGTKTYLNELADELKRDGIISEDSTISSTADLLDAIGAASAETANAFDIPPLSVDGLRETIRKTTESVAKIDPAQLIPQSEIAKMWNGMQEIAEREDVTVFEVSSAMTMYALDHVNTVTQGALTTIRVTGDLLDRHLFDHYWQGLQEITDRGIYAMVAESSKPYIDAVWFNFSSERPTVTEDVVSGRMMGRVWSGLCDWMAGKDEDQKK